MKVSIVIPCYNEEEGIPNLISQLDPVLKNFEDYEVIFVDDGSKDNTFNLLKEYSKKNKKVKIIRHKCNKNLGGALKSAFKNAKGDIIVATDSDCTYSPLEIPKMIKLLDKDTDIVSASPYHPKGCVENVPGYRLFLSKGISKIYSLILGSKIYTYTSMFRAYKKDVLKNVEIKSDNFLGVTELIVYSLLKDYKVKEYPTTLHVRKYGTSKIKLFNIILSHFKFILKLLKIKLLRK